MSVRATAQERLLFGGDTPWKIAIPEGLVIVGYGGGVNTIALLVLLKRLGVTPKAIVMSDPGSEWPETISYRDNVAAPWLAANGFPAIEVISRASETTGHRETLKEESRRTRSLPSVAYGFKRCSLKFKAEPQMRWLARQPWAIEEWGPVRRRKKGETEPWQAKRKIVKAIGYDADEGARIRPFWNEWEAARCVPWYPLFDGGLGRDDCEALIKSEGLPIPHLSACTFCPNNSVEDWEELRRVHPDLFQEALEMEANARIEEPEIIGLMRRQPIGKKSLRVWNQTGTAAKDRDLAIPCECAA